MLVLIPGFGVLWWLGLYLLNRRRWLAGVSSLMLAAWLALRIIAPDAATTPRFSATALLLAGVGGWLIDLWRQRRSGWILSGFIVLLFALGAGVALMMTSNWAVLLIVIAALGGGRIIIALDARERGEAWVPDLLRSLDFSVFAALIFGGQIALVMAFVTGATFTLVVLLLSVIATAIASQVYADALQAVGERIAYATFPHLRAEQQDLRITARSLVRLEPAVDWSSIDADEFSKLVRRAISDLGNLPRLVSSPLIHLPAIDQRLARPDGTAEPLERAAELKALLTERIETLKPRDNGTDFGTSDEWRHFNALYFPYVMGLKPYSRRADHEHLEDATAHQALDWLRTYVPERTLRNWQTAAAAVIAHDLRAHCVVESTDTYAMKST